MKSQIALVLILFTVICIPGCNGIKKDNKLFTLHNAKSSKIDFSNQIFETIDLNIINFESMYNGAGVGVGDFNNDGLQDIYFAANMVSGRLYLNTGSFKFQDVTDKSGIKTENKWGTGVSVVDINADGFLDLYLCFAGPYANELRKNQLYINNGDLTFSEQAANYGLDDDGHTTHAAFFDFDRDGDLDVYLLTNTTDEMGPNIIRPKRNNGEMINTDRLYQNNNGFFKDVSKEAGILKEGYGLGIAIGDVNMDGWPDIFVGNDYLSNDQLYINNMDGTFTDKASEYFKHTSYSSMGCHMADYNNDGLPDIVALEMLPYDQTRRNLMFSSMDYERYYSEIDHGYFPQFKRNTLQLNRGKTTNQQTVFSEIGFLAGMYTTHWSWSSLLADLDNDGLKDLAITNGYPRDITNLDFVTFKRGLMSKGQYNKNMLIDLIDEVVKNKGAYLPNFAFRNKGDLRFVDVSTEWGFTQPTFSHGAAVADLDNDGDLDYIVNNSYDEAYIYENNEQKLFQNHYLRLKLHGIKRNLNALGSKVWLYQDSLVQYHEHFPFRGYRSSIEQVVHFGLGKTTEIDSVIICWPDNQKQIIINPIANQVLDVTYSPLSSYYSYNKQKNKNDQVFSHVEAVDFVHFEPQYHDFLRMPLLPHKHSQDGPGLCVGDVNNDGLDDFYIGGACGQAGSIFKQQQDGTFKELIFSIRESKYEDLGCEFFDSDGDGDLDLYVTSGSNEFPEGSENYLDRIYINDGHGNFNYKDGYLPEIKTSTSCVASTDFDNDGDLDLFVGGRITPGQYPKSPQSYLLENRNGKFENITSEKGQELMHCGMITDACWLDVNQDGWKDLIVCGEWIPISVFINNHGKLIKSPNDSGLEQTVGWWNSMTAGDLDNDGDMDLVAGNLGLNSLYKTSDEKPFSMFVDDFDNNGKLDPIMVHYLQDRRVPVHFRDDLISWIKPLEQKFPDYTSFAEANWVDIFPGVASRQIDINTFASIWIENLSNGKFIIHELNITAQISSVFGILIKDFNKDNIPDILLTGNTSASNTFEGQLDAFFGLLMLGDGLGEFIPQDIQESGFFVPGEGRALNQIKNANGYPLILAAQNNDRLITFKY